MLGALAFAMGASIGSFLNVVIDRLPAGRSVVTPGSYCEACKRPLAWRDLLPIVSYLWLRGRCRYCGAAIPWRLMAMEASTGLLFALVYLRYSLGVDFAIIGGAVCLLLIFAFIDLEHGLILNRILFPTLALLLVLAPFWSELGLSRPFLGSETMAASLFNSLVAGAGAFLCFLGIALAFPRGMGAGDVKLAGWVGLLVGLPDVFVALWIAFVVGGVTAVALILTHKKGRKDAIPFGPFLALGALAALLAGGEIISLFRQASSSFAGRLL